VAKLLALFLIKGILMVVHRQYQFFKIIDDTIMPF
jgi:hypothetical protein